MWAAMEWRRGYWTVQLMHLEAIPAPTVKMLGLPTIQLRFRASGRISLLL